MSLFKKISSIKGFVDSNFIDENADIRDFISTGVYIIDLMLSGKILDGGIPKGKISQISSPSALGKCAAYEELYCFYVNDNSDILSLIEKYNEDNPHKKIIIE